MHVRAIAFPDFVFNDNYKLLSLNERELFIKKHRHLPHLLSAKEVENQGVPVELVMEGILQNTEELTLYLIDLSKQIEDLKKENQSLKIAFSNLINSK